MVKGLRRRGLKLTHSELAATLAVVLGLLVSGAAFALSAYTVSPLAAPIALVGITFAVLTFVRPAIGLAGALLATPLEIANLNVLSGAISPTDAALALVAGAWLCRALLRPETVAKPAVRDLPVIVLLMIVALGIGKATDPTPVIRVFVVWTLFYFAYLQAQTLTTREMKGVVGAFLVGAGILGLIGTVDYLRSGETGLLAGGETTLARAEGTFGNPNSYASLLVLALLPGLALVIADVRRAGWLLVPAAGALGGVVFSLSRGGIATFVLGLLLLLLWGRARWVAVGVAALFVALTLANANPLIGSQQFEVVGQRLSTLDSQQFEVSDRPRIWGAAVDMAIENPFIGVGMNQFQFEAARRGVVTRGEPFENAHSIPLSLAAETGILGLAAFLAFVGQLVARAVKAIGAARGSTEYALALGMSAALLAFMLQGLTIVQLRTPILAGTFFVLAGMLTALADRVAREPATARAAPAQSFREPALASRESPF